MEPREGQGLEAGSVGEDEGGKRENLIGKTRPCVGLRLMTRCIQGVVVEYIERRDRKSVV